MIDKNVTLVIKGQQSGVGRGVEVCHQSSCFGIALILIKGVVAHGATVVGKKGSQKRVTQNACNPAVECLHFRRGMLAFQKRNTCISEAG